MKWIVIFSIEWHCCLRKGAIARHRKGLTGEITFKLSSKIDSWGEGLQFLQARIHTSVHHLQKLVRLHYKCIFNNNKNTFQVEIWKMVWTYVQKSCLNDLETQESISPTAPKKLASLVLIGK